MKSPLFTTTRQAEMAGGAASAVYAANTDTTNAVALSATASVLER